jgi:hypothetical protein
MGHLRESHGTHLRRERIHKLRAWILRGRHAISAFFE